MGVSSGCRTSRRSQRRRRASGTSWPEETIFSACVGEWAASVAHLNTEEHGVQQRLGGVRLRLKAAALKTTDDATRAGLDTLGNTVDETTEDVRSIAYQL